MDKLTKKHNHLFFWTENGVVYETYRTIRGNRYMSRAAVDYPDKDRLTQKDIDIIQELLLIKEN